MLRRPPRSTLFPYPPLFRSAPGHLHEFRADRGEHLPRLVVDAVVAAQRAGVVVGDPVVEGLRRREAADEAPRLPDRSEEHTSELQSQSNLVCRLLLEKKKYK